MTYKELINYCKETRGCRECEHKNECDICFHEYDMAPVNVERYLNIDMEKRVK